MKRLLFGLALLSLTSLAFAQKKTDYSKVPSLVKEEKEKGNYKLADSLAKDYMDNYLFKLTENQLMSKDNLSFINENLTTTDIKGFKLFFKQRNKVNSVLGPHKAEYAIRYAIAKQYIPKEIEQNSGTIDWEKIEYAVVTKFGALGQETFYGNRMEYYFNAKDWNNFGKYYMLYFEKALKRPEYDINDTTWFLFENVNDPKALKFACDVVMKYAMGEWYETNVNAYDTYANLLYKMGNKDKAIEWEEKALRLAKGNEYLEKQFMVALGKMQKNEKTWKETSINP